MGDPAFQGTSDVCLGILEMGQQINAGKGFSAVGLNDILTAAGVPKGSFYHYFGSKDAFGEALLEHYFKDYLTNLDETLRKPAREPGQAQSLVSWRGNAFCMSADTSALFSVAC